VEEFRLRRKKENSIVTFKCNVNLPFWEQEDTAARREYEDVTVLWNWGVHTDSEVMTDRPDVNKDKKEGNMRTDRCDNISG